MPNLVIVIPFKANEECDLDKTATEMQDFFASIESNMLGENVGSTIDNIKIVHLKGQYSCTASDYVILFAHGGMKDTNLCNNQGQAISMDQAVEKLEGIRAQDAKRVLFMCCFSGLEGHVGDTWKNTYPAQETYGGHSVISNFYSSTRKQIRAVCQALTKLV